MADNFNWEAFRQTSLSLSIDELSQCSKLGIDSYTLQLAKYFCNQYPILQSRKQDLSRAVESSILANIDSDHKPALGSNIYHLVKLISSLASSESGISLLCICNVLGNYYPAESTVEIFEALVKESDVPDDLVPPGTAWESLKPLFESLQGPPIFGALVDKYTALGNLDFGDGEGTGRPEIKHNGAPGVVVTFMVMSHLVRGEQPPILCLVGKDAGWTAAVAE